MHAKNILFFKFLFYFLESSLKFFVACTCSWFEFFRLHFNVSSANEKTVVKYKHAVKQRTAKKQKKSNWRLMNFKKKKMLDVFLVWKQHLSSLCLYDPSTIIIIILIMNIVIVIIFVIIHYFHQEISSPPKINVTISFIPKVCKGSFYLCSLSKICSYKKKYSLLALSL